MNIEKINVIENKEILAFVLLDTPFCAFELQFENGALRVSKKAFWRVIKNGKVLFCSLDRKTEKRSGDMSALFENKKVKKVTTRPCGDVIITLSGSVKLELLTPAAGVSVFAK